MLPRGGSRNHPALRKTHLNGTQTNMGSTQEVGEFVDLNSWRSQEEGSAEQPKEKHQNREESLKETLILKKMGMDARKSTPQQAINTLNNGRSKKVTEKNSPREED